MKQVLQRTKPKFEIVLSILQFNDKRTKQRLCHRPIVQLVFQLGYDMILNISSILVVNGVNGRILFKVYFIREKKFEKVWI